MLILATDTATDYASFAVGNEEGELFGAVVFKHNRSLSQQFYGGMNQVLNAAGIPFSQIDVLAVGVGPGSFTGVRVGVTTMRTLAQASQKQLVGVGTLAIYAHEASTMFDGLLAAVLPSRKNELYYQEFADGSAVAAPKVFTFPALDLELRSRSISLCGQTQILPGDLRAFSIISQTAPPPASLIHEASMSVRRRNFADPLTLSPVYVVPPSISQHKYR